MRLVGTSGRIAAGMFCAALALAALAGQPMTARAAPCDGPPAGWSAIEQAAWHSFLSGAPFDAEQWPSQDGAPPALSAGFLRDVLTCETLAANLPDRSIVLRNAGLAGALDLARKTVLVRFDCDTCLLPAIQATETQWRDRLALVGSTVLGDADFSFGAFQSSLLLRGTAIAGVLDLYSAQLGGDLLIDGESRIRAIAAESASIERSVELRGAQIWDYADFWGAAIGRDFILTGAWQDDTLTGWTVIGAGATKEALMAVDATSPAVLSLGSARIDRRIDITNAQIRGRLDLDAVRVAEDLWLRGCSVVAGPIKLVFARIGQNVDFSSTMLRDVDMTGGRVGGELRLGAPAGRLTAPVWKSDARLSLRNVELSSWTDATGNDAARDPNCPPVRAAADPWPRQIDVIGFSYQNVGGYAGGSPVLQHDVDWFCRWLERQVPYSFEPYQHAAAYLRGVGLEDAADDVLYCGKVLQIENTSSWAGKFVLQVQRAFVGFGYRVERSMIWALLFIILGQQIFSRSREAKAHNMPFGLAYSIEMFIPALSLRSIHGSIDLAGWQRYYFYLHKFMGWVLGSFVVATFLGLLGE